MGEGLKFGSTQFRGPAVDQPDQHMKEREAEKTADLESLADALAAFRQLHRGLDQWERVHLALCLAAVVSGCYGIGACVDGPLDARGKMRNLTGGSTAVMYPASHGGILVKLFHHAPPRL